MGLRFANERLAEKVLNYVGFTGDGLMEWHQVLSVATKNVSNYGEERISNVYQIAFAKENIDLILEYLVNVNLHDIKLTSESEDIYFGRLFWMTFDGIMTEIFNSMELK